MTLRKFNPRAFYKSYQRNSVDGTMARLRLMADWFRQRGYYGLIIIHVYLEYMGTPTYLEHIFRLYHPDMEVKHGWVRAVEKELTAMVDELLPGIGVGLRSRHWSPNAPRIPIAPTGHILPMWCDLTCSLPIGGIAPNDMRYVTIKEWKE